MEASDRRLSEIRFGAGIVSNTNIFDLCGRDSGY